MPSVKSVLILICSIAGFVTAVVIAAIWPSSVKINKSDSANKIIAVSQEVGKSPDTKLPEMVSDVSRGKTNDDIKPKVDVPPVLPKTKIDDVGKVPIAAVEVAAPGVEGDVIVLDEKSVVSKDFIIAGKEKGVEHRLVNLEFHRNDAGTSTIELGECNIYAGRKNPCSLTFFIDNDILMPVMTVCGRTETYYMHSYRVEGDVGKLVNPKTKPYWSKEDRGIVISDFDNEVKSVQKIVIKFIGGEVDDGQKTPKGADNF